MPFKSLVGLTPSDYERADKARANGNAVAGTPQAARAGANAFRLGKSVSDCTYKNPVLIEAWEAGFRHAAKLKEAKKGK